MFIRIGLERGDSFMFSIIPIAATPNYTFSSKVPVDGQNIVLGFELRYNELAGYWIVTIRNERSDLIAGLPVLPAQNILEQYEYLQIGSAYIVPAQTVAEQWPSRYTLGAQWYLVWGDTDGRDIYG